MCKHANKTVVYYDGITDIGNGPEALFFTAYQCDDCGMLLDAVDSETVAEQPAEPPTMDKAAYWAALQKAAKDVVKLAKEGVAQK